MTLQLSAVLPRFARAGRRGGAVAVQVVIAVASLFALAGVCLASQCQVTTTTIPFDGPGLSGAQIFNSVSGEWSGTLTWRTPNATKFLVSSLTRTAFKLKVRNPGVTQNAEGRLEPDYEDTAMGCISTVRVQVDMDLKTDDEAIQHQWRTFLVGMSHRPSFQVTAPAMLAVKAPRSAPAPGLMTAKGLRVVWLKVDLSFETLSGTVSAMISWKRPRPRSMAPGWTSTEDFAVIEAILKLNARKQDITNQRK